MAAVKVQAIMTAPRYENTWCRTIIESALRRMNIPLNVGLGVFYGQNMQRMMEEALDVADYVVTIDFDTAFIAQQLHRLISLAVQEDLDAVCGIQVKRGCKHMLGFKEGVSSAKWDGHPIEVDAAHFGLTVISTAKLRNVAKPWFFCQPDKDGRWGDDRIDSDVWFWRQWKAAGNKLYIDPGVRLGHMEEMVVMHDENMEPVHVYPKQWEKLIQNDFQHREDESDTTDKALEAVPSGASAN